MLVKVRRVVVVFVCFLVVVGGVVANGQTKGAFPEDVVRVVVSFGAGGSNDVLARIAALHTEKYLGQNIVVENYPGGGQVLGQLEAWNSPADGYTLLTINPGIIQSPILKEVPFKYNDWEPLVVYNLDPEVFAVRADSPYKTFADVIEASKEKPLLVAVPGAQTNPHICGLYVEKQTGAKFKYVYGESGAEEVMQLVGGHVDAVINTVGAVYSTVQEGEVRLLGVMGEEVTETIKEVAPDVTTFYDQGYDVGYWAWRGLAVKKGTPQEAIDVLSEAFGKAASDPEFIKGFEEAGFAVVYKGGKDLKDFIEYQNAYMSELLSGM